jgi:hypothetical protein
MSILHSYQFSNRLRHLNRLAQIALTLLLIAGINYGAMRWYQRTDLAYRRGEHLSPETLAYLRELDQPVRFIVTIPRASPRNEEQLLHRYVSTLLHNYAYHGRRGAESLIAIEYVDLYKDLARAEQLARDHGLNQPNSILVMSGDRKRILRAEELLELADFEPVAFTGEAALTSALLEVTRDQAPIMYFLSGHGEMMLDDVSPARGLSLLAGELRARNYRLHGLDLTREPEVPADAGLVVIADPQGPLLPAEVQKLRTWLADHAGRLLLWFGPGSRHGLDALLRDWGVRADDMVIFEGGLDYIEGAGTILIRNYGEHPATHALIRHQAHVVAGLSRPVRADPGAPIDERLHLTPLLGSSAASWAEASWQSEDLPRFTPETDLPGPVSLAMAAERRAASQLGINIPGGRVAVFGTRDLFVNRRIHALGNLTLFFGTLNWMLDRDQMLAIPPRPIDSYQLTVSQAQLRHIALAFLLVPGAVALFGIAVTWMRKF